MNKTVVIGIVFVLVALGFIVYSSMNMAQYRVEVCMAFQGHKSCRTASADTQDHAMRSAVNNACALIASGVTDTMSCERGTPTSVRWLRTK